MSGSRLVRGGIVACVLVAGLSACDDAKDEPPCFLTDLMRQENDVIAAAPDVFARRKERLVVRLASGTEKLFTSPAAPSCTSIYKSGEALDDTPLALLNRYEAAAGLFVVERVMHETSTFEVCWLADGACAAPQGGDIVLAPDLRHLATAIDPTQGGAVDKDGRPSTAVVMIYAMTPGRLDEAFALTPAGEGDDDMALGVQGLEWAGPDRLDVRFGESHWRISRGAAGWTAEKDAPAP